MNLTEFGRAVHAEMEAILAAARVGISVRDAVLYTTTFPCHNCAKHIVGAGLHRVVYVEPYSKSLAQRLHGDAIFAQPDEGEEAEGSREAHRVRLDAFIGVAPRQYPRLFSMMSWTGEKWARKDAEGNTHVDPGLRVAASPMTYIEKEATVADYLDHLMEEITKGPGGKK